MHATSPAPAAVGGLLALQPILFAVPLVVLGQAIGWPASLRLPAAEALPLIHAQAGAVALGYWAYLLVSLAMVPLAFALRAWCAARGLGGWAVDALAFTGAAAGILKMLGIVRWLSVMPGLAAAWVEGPEAGRAVLEASYAAMNAYAGAVGEVLGVQLTWGVWLAGTGAALARLGRRAIGLAGVAAGALLVLTCLRTVVPEAAMLATVAMPLGLAWFLAAAWSLRRG